MYYLVFGLLYFASLLPFRVLYVISDVLAFFLYDLLFAVFPLKLK